MSGFNFDILSVIVGVAIGWVAFYIKHLIEIRKYKKEIEEYKGHLNRQMKITQEGNKALIDEIEKLKKENENLRITVKTLGQKPGRSELRLLNVYDSALRKMMLKAPGFSSAWEMALQEAEREYEENEKGLRTVIKKVFGPSISHKSAEEGENSK
ncbi:MAG: hypothetical protein GXO31_08975 [Epsilonproteobacteria bacterium]|nr:hypothetical protein [Campylobacterota bacterium]